MVCPANIKSNIAEATKLRPAHFGASGHAAGEAAVASLHSIHSQGMEPLQLAQFIMDGIKANQLYILPYPEAKAMLRQHFAQIIDAIPELETDPEGARLRTEALMNWAKESAGIFGGR